MDLIPLTVPEVRQLLLALTEPDERFSFRLAWSTFRRRHQATAQRCHATRRVKRQFNSTNSTNSSGMPCISAAQMQVPIQVLRPGNFELTDELWRRICPLLPPQKPHTGRPSNDHRMILGGMLWVMRTGVSWRELPASFGSWQTLYSRYQRWSKAGIWQQIVDALQQGEIDA